MDPAKTALSSPAACDDANLPAQASPNPPSNPGGRPPVKPSVPQSSLGAAAAQQETIAFAADRSAPRAGESVVLTATASATVTGTASAIEIFDQTTGTVAGACMQSSRCRVAYSATGGVHSFAAFIMPPSATTQSGAAVASNPVQVSWLAVSLKSNLPSIVGPGKPVTLTASRPFPSFPCGSPDTKREGTVGLPLSTVNQSAF
jgi:hypothetical protein